MLAPLEDRSVLHDEANDEVNVDFEIRELRRALRASRLRLRRSALQGTRQLMALNAEVLRLQTLCDRQAVQIARYAVGTVIVDMGKKLMALSAANERLIDDSRRAVMLERVLGITDAERRRLSLERDALANELCRYRHDAPLGSNLHGGGHVEIAV